MTTKQQQVPVSLRVVSSVAWLLFAVYALLHGLGGHSVMAWVAFVLFLTLVAGSALGKIPSMADKSRYKIHLLTFLAVSVAMAWMIAERLTA